jgi:hypothetical protein
MENVDRLVREMLTSDDPGRVSWGKQIVAAQRYDFGGYDDFQKTVTAEKATSYFKSHLGDAGLPLPHHNYLCYCDDFIFMHVMMCPGGFFEVRAAITVQEMEGFFLYPIYLKVKDVTTEISCAPFLDSKKMSKKWNEENSHWLFRLHCTFYVGIHDYPDKVKIKTIKDRRFTLEEIAALTEIPFDVIAKRAEEEHWPSAALGA